MIDEVNKTNCGFGGVEIASESVNIAQNNSIQCSFGSKWGPYTSEQWKWKDTQEKCLLSWCPYITAAREDE